MKKSKRMLKRLHRRLDAIETVLLEIDTRQLTIATTLAPLAYDLRLGGWHLPLSHPGEVDDITEMVRKRKTQ